MMRVKFIDLKPNSQLQAELDEAYVRVMSSGQYIGGSEVESFEREWADYCQSQYCISTSSGQAALEILLRAHGIGHGDKVIVPSWTAVPTWKAVLNIGAQVLPVDVGQESMLLELSSQLDLALQETSYIIPVHLYGTWAYDGYEISIIDACQAHGMKKLGNAVFSFYPTKNLGAYGDGGAIVTNNQDLAQECRDIRDSNRLDPLQAAFLRVKLKYLDKNNSIRLTNARLYDEFLSDEIHKALFGNWFIFHQYVIRTDKRDELKVFLAKRGIETMIHYPVPPHRQLGLGFDLPIADKLAQTVLSLPIMISEENVWKVIKVVNEFASQS